MMSQTVRSFIAIELPAAVLSLLDSVQQELKGLRLKARWVRPQNIHLTLKFLGNIDSGEIEKIGRAMVDATVDSAPFTLTIGGIGFFPDIKRPRVIWVGLDGAKPALFNLQRNLADRLAIAGFPKEERSFKAHLTLGRIRQAVNPNIVDQAIQGYSDLGDLKFTVNRIILFKSDLKPSGAEYSHLKQMDVRKMNIEY